MRQLDYAAPGSIDEALAILTSEDAIPLAGGTDLIVARQAGKIDPGLVVDLRQIPGLDAIVDEGDGLRLGSMVTMTSLTRSDLVQARCPVVAEAAALMGCWQVRNLATLGGNLCNASPSAEMGPPLLIHDATVVLQSTGGTREVPLAGFLTGPGATALVKPELMTAVRVPAAPSGLRSAYERRSIRRSMDIPLVNTAVGVATEDGVVTDARVALGAVAPIPFRVPAAEELLVGRRLDAELVRAAAEASCCPARPIDDVRASAEYRLAMVEVLVRRALERLMEGLS